MGNPIWQTHTSSHLAPHFGQPVLFALLARIGIGIGSGSARESFELPAGREFEVVANENNERPRLVRINLISHQSARPSTGERVTFINKRGPQRVPADLGAFERLTGDEEAQIYILI